LRYDHIRDPYLLCSQVKLPGGPPDEVFIDVDYSGLYLLLATVHENMSSIALLEIGTGSVAWEHHHLPRICSAVFSSRATFAIGTERGVIVWNLQGQIAATAERVAAAAARSEGFWERSCFHFWHFDEFTHRFFISDTQSI